MSDESSADYGESDIEAKAMREAATAQKRTSDTEATAERGTTPAGPADGTVVERDEVRDKESKS